MEYQMPQPNDLSRSLIPFGHTTTLVAVIELSQSSWLIAGTIPGIERQPLKKIVPDETELLRVLHRWRDEAVRKGRTITRIAVAFEAGRDGFWLARWLTGHGIEAHVIHSSSVAVSREHKRAKTDRLDTGILMRVFLGWLRGERGHCGMVAIPTIEAEDAKRPSRERENLVGERTRIINRLKSSLLPHGATEYKVAVRSSRARAGSPRIVGEQTGHRGSTAVPLSPGSKAVASSAHPAGWGHTIPLRNGEQSMPQGRQPMRRELSIARPSHRMCAVSQVMCV
jgi:transposase